MSDGNAMKPMIEELIQETNSWGDVMLFMSLLQSVQEVIVVEVLHGALARFQERRGMV